VRSLPDKAFPIFVTEALKKFDLIGDRWFFAITESVAMEADSTVWWVFEELANIGVRLVIDDFGRGFSNLARLRGFPFVAIKIDCNFIRNLPNSPKDPAIFRAMHVIAKELDLKTVAEGIETAKQEEFVSRFGVDYFQEYRFGHPMPVDKLKRYTRH
jgi:EAL domain-containing protein (putative c-di-GMP-specific phosphodiesterase class I)